jgi:hypothetical protein
MPANSGSLRLDKLVVARIESCRAGTINRRSRFEPGSSDYENVFILVGIEYFFIAFVNHFHRQSSTLPGRRRRLDRGIVGQ